MAKLDRKAEERLKKLEEEWDKEATDWLLEKLTLADLRLLLEHFKPLRKLIRQIAQQGIPPEPTAPLAEDVDTATAPHTSPEETSLLRERCATLEQQLGDLQKRLEQSDRDLQQARMQRDTLRAERDQLQKDLRDAQVRLQALDRTRPSSVMDSLVRWLKHHPEAANRLDLQDLGSETQDLIRLVAVLSQWNNILRLHELLTEAGHTHGKADEEGVALLDTALAWHNHNWRERPYRTERPTPGAAFDYTRQQRMRHTPTGERIAQVLVPAIIDSSGKVICKAVVETH